MIKWNGVKNTSIHSLAQKKERGIPRANGRKKIPFSRNSKFQITLPQFLEALHLPIGYISGCLNSFSGTVQLTVLSLAAPQPLAEHRIEYESQCIPT